jgi:hypothetical protein
MMSAHPPLNSTLGFGDQMHAVFKQFDQQMEGTRADVHRCAGRQQTSFIGLELEPSKPIAGRCGRSSHLWRRRAS